MCSTPRRHQNHAKLTYTYAIHTYGAMCEMWVTLLPVYISQAGYDRRRRERYRRVTVTSAITRHGDGRRMGSASYIWVRSWDADDRVPTAPVH